MADELSMASSPTTSAQNGASSPKTSSSISQKRPRRPNHNYIHRHLLPVEVHPLPVLIPHNPLSLVAIALSYLTQILCPPARPTYNGYFSSATSSIHVTDADTIRKLWEMGFFGRGSLSRSEPNWLENRKKKGATAEENTQQRRQERRKQKLERARKEQEEIDLKLAEEKRLNGNDNGSVTGQMNALLDPTPLEESRPNGHLNGNANGVLSENILKTNATDISDIGSVLSSVKGSVTLEAYQDRSDGSIHGFEEWKNTIEANGIPTPPPTSTSSEASQPEAPGPNQAQCRPIRRLQRTKTVRFSPTIEAREFDLSSPVISPIKSPGSSPLEEVTTVTPTTTSSPSSGDHPSTSTHPSSQNQEHLTLSLEEAFFLSYALGVLDIFCDDSNTILPPSSLLSLFRRHSYHPPRSLSMPAEPDDPFMVSYVVYHHYRSLGWVVRSGVKFGTDYLLYRRGPAFSHAEFAVCVVPSYIGSYWSERSETSEEQQRSLVVEKKSTREGKSWHALHALNRVQAQVHKQLVLCYVDIPPPLKNEKGKDVDIGFLLGRYKIRDINVKRWTPNRARD